MYFLIRFDVSHPSSLSLDQVHAIWDEEAKATQGARDAGVLQGWEVVGQRVIVAIGQFDTHDALDRTLMELPIMKRLGGSVTVEVRSRAGTHPGQRASRARRHPAGVLRLRSGHPSGERAEVRFLRAPRGARRLLRGGAGGGAGGRGPEVRQVGPRHERRSSALPVMQVRRGLRLQTPQCFGWRTSERARALRSARRLQAGPGGIGPYGGTFVPIGRATGSGC